MIRKIGFVLFCFFSISTFACTNALPTNHVDFCPSFKTAATCYCAASGIPAGLCQDMKMIFDRMISVFGSLQRACEFQKYTTPQDCINNWNCYRLGGVDSQGRWCSATKRSCQ